MLPKAVVDYLESHCQEHLAELMELIRFRSIANTEPEECLRCAEWLVARLERLGMAARVVEGEGRPNVIGALHVRDDAPTVLVYAHYDVQPADPLEQWRTEPFEPVVRDGCLWARGASDDKGPLVAHLAAIEAWQRAGGGLPVNVKVLVEGDRKSVG
jgi:acetylornithine deacetylase/succinyl-diaminopimelate desuccinylase-like protein